MTESQELKLQLLKEFAISDEPKSIEFCKKAYEFMAEESTKGFGLIQQRATQADNMGDGIYLVFADGSSVLFDPNDQNIQSESEVKYIGVKWGKRSIAVALRDQANGKDIALTSGKDKTNYDGYIDTYLEAVADWNGKANTEHLKAIGLNKEIVLADGEYIPSLGEMYFVFLNRKAINEALEAVGGTPIDGVWYWTSTEYSATGAWYLYLFNGHAFTTTKATLTGRVRPVSAFIS